MEKILVLDFGGQYNQLIARKVRQQHIYAEIQSYSRIRPEEILKEGYKGIIFTGGPNSVYDDDSPHYTPEILKIGIPILGICYGAQLLAYMAGGKVSPAGQSAEYGKTNVIKEESNMFREIPSKSVCWMSHSDFIQTVPPGFRITAYTDSCPCAGMEDPDRRLYALQFHPEVTHTAYGEQIFSNFLYGICGCRGDWIVEDYAERMIEKYRRDLAGRKVLLAMSGGVDSSVAAVLLHRAIGRDLACVFVDHGLLRKDEGDLVERTFGREMGINLIRVNVQNRFLNRLAGVTDPEEKRKIIGEEFIRVFEEEASKLGDVTVLAQGTIYPDIIESGKDDSAVIKSHHNVGGLPDFMTFDEIVEPLKYLFKDEVREIGAGLGIPHELVYRQPFPGPGLAVRIVGEITPEKISILQEADSVFREETVKALPGRCPDQFFAVLTDSRSVGVMGDARTYGYTVALRAVTTDDFMTAEWTKLPFSLLEKVSSRITNEVKGITRVVYDITSKPPATVEWE